MSTTRKNVTRKLLALAIVFAIVFALFAPMAAADTETTITWDNSVLSAFDGEEAVRYSKGITFTGTEYDRIYQSYWGPSMLLGGQDPTFFSSNVGKIKSIVINSTEIDKGIADDMNLSDGWECENNTFTWSGTPADNVQFTFGRLAFIALDSIIFTVEGGSVPHTHDWGSWTIIKEATEDQEGIEIRVCNIDNSHKETRGIPKLISKAESPVLSTSALLLNTGLKATQKGSKLNVKFGKVTDATSYEVFVAYCGKKFPTKPTVTTKVVKKISINKLHGKKLNLKKVFKVYVVAKKGNAKLGKSMTAYIAGKDAKKTNSKSIKLNSKDISLLVGENTKITATVIPVNKKKKILSYESKLRFTSANNNIAAVTKKGKVTAKEKGTCDIYVFANNGNAAKVKVTVK